MAKRILQGRTQNKGVGKLYGRSYGPMVYNDHVGLKVTPKIDAAINYNLDKK